MAALARSNPGGTTTHMATNSAKDTERILAASQRNLEAIGTVRESVTELRSELGYVKRSVDDLTKKVEKVDELKASRVDLQQVEARGERAVADLRAQVAKDISQLDKDKIGTSEFSVDSFENFSLRIDSIEKSFVSMERKISALLSIEKLVESHEAKIGDLDKLRWKLYGGGGVLLLVGSLLGWFLNFLSHK